jgi:hypothetical protein
MGTLAIGCARALDINLFGMFDWGFNWWFVLALLTPLQVRMPVSGQRLCLRALQVTTYHPTMSGSMFPSVVTACSRLTTA